MPPPTTRRIRLTLHYDGGAFFGWQFQPHHRTVQGEIERVLIRLFGAPARIVGAGRTDRGVHATGQVAAVDAPGRWSPPELRRALNALLPADIWVADAAPAADNFHPRYDALSRSYVYRLGWMPESNSPFHRRWCWPLREQPDGARLEEGAAELPGEHSFAAFAKSGQEERGDRCTVSEAVWKAWPPLGLEFHITANRFLHHMVRYLVGTLVDVGVGHRPATDIRELLRGAGARLTTSPPAPPQGLFLSAVRYPSSVLHPAEANS